MSDQERTNKPQFGDIIRSRRHEMHLRIVDLSNKTGMSSGYISRLEQNEATSPSDAAIFYLERALGFEEGYLKQFLPERSGNSRRVTLQDRRIVASAPRKNDMPLATPGLPPLRQEDWKTMKPASHPEWDPETHENASMAAIHLYSGMFFCSMEQFKEGLDAYERAEAICKDFGIVPYLHQIRYRLARTYQTLGRQKQNPLHENVMYYHWRALYYLNLITAAHIETLKSGADAWNPNIEELSASEWTLLPAALAVSGSVYAKVCEEILSIGQVAKEIPTLKYQPEGGNLAGEAGYMARLAVIKHKQADAFYKRLVGILERKHAQRDASAAETSGDLLEQIAYVYFLRGLNSREEVKANYNVDNRVHHRHPERKENTQSLAESRMKFQPSYEHFCKAIDTLLLAVQTQHAPATHDQKQQLGRYHQELALMYRELIPEESEWESIDPTELEEVLTGALANLKVAKQLMPDPVDRYVKGDQNLIPVLAEIESQLAGSHIQSAIEANTERTKQEVLQKLESEQ